LANGDLIKLGTLYVGGTKLARPTKPWRTDITPPGAPSAGDIPSYTVRAAIEIRDTDVDDAYKIQWREVNIGTKKLLVADRNLLVNISWDDLNAQSLVSGKTITIDGQQYKLRLLTAGSNYRSGTDAYSGGSPTTNEWDQIIVNEANYAGFPIPAASDLDTTQDATDFNSAHNQYWNWFYIYSWGKETYTGNSAYRAIRGYYSARSWNYFSSGSRYTNLGWRPVLEFLNSAPVISGTDSNLGNKPSSFTVNYSVDDIDATDILTVTEKVDATTIRTINNAVRGQTYTLDLSSVWSSLSLGSHTITITVTDGKGGTATRTYTFTKTDDRIKFTLKNPIQTSIAAKKIVVSGVVTVPTGATLSVKACNNSFDSNPTWEDITQKFLNRESHTFTNASKTAAKWGINLQFEIIKGTATDQIIVDGFGFSFE
jgi:hypothetical protein